MPSYGIALRGLSHPWTLLSIGVLLLNDHVLKSFAPSFLTGKLSDFAGLFFFPFLLSVPIGLALGVLGVRSHRVCVTLSVGITFLWFTLTKTTAWVNEGTLTVVEHISGHPAAIERDPSDLVALPMLVFAWKLWSGLDEQLHAQRVAGTSMWKGFAALALASASTLATTCVVDPAVTKLVFMHGGIYTSNSEIRLSFHLLQFRHGHDLEVSRTKHGTSGYTNRIG